jgi:hypothetical protein
MSLLTFYGALSGRVNSKTERAHKIIRTFSEANHAAGAGITAKQWAALEALCKAKGFKAAAVLAHFHVSKPREIPADRFAEAAALIEKVKA